MNNINDKIGPHPFKRMAFVIHIVTWVILLGIPLFFTGRGREAVTPESYLRSLIMIVSFMVIFYTNFLFLINKYLFTRQRTRFFITNIVLILGVMLLVHLAMHTLPAPIGIGEKTREVKDIIAFFCFNSLLYALVAALSVAIKMTDSWYKSDTQRRELEQTRTEMEIQNLKNQLNPHFLFNTLNNIYSLIAINQEQAQHTVHELSRLLRYVLYESSKSLVPLEKDMDFVRNYVELMRIRLSPDVRLDTHIAISSPGELIAPLLFISLIENAFKHGVSNGKDSFITISIVEEKGNLLCNITNSNYPKAVDKDKSGSGIGLINLKKRLVLLYPHHHILNYGVDEDHFYISLAINLNPMNNETKLCNNR
ncbi:MAG: sensor histidine kinase [Marinifilaceae bacterium]